MRFKITYQDKALNEIYIYLEGEGWASSIVEALANLKAGEKLKSIECLDGSDVTYIV